MADNREAKVARAEAPGAWPRRVVAARPAWLVNAVAPGGEGVVAGGRATLSPTAAENGAEAAEQVVAGDATRATTAAPEPIGRGVVAADVAGSAETASARAGGEAPGMWAARLTRGSVPASAEASVTSGMVSARLGMATETGRHDGRALEAPGAGPERGASTGPTAADGLASRHGPGRSEDRSERAQEKAERRLRIDLYR